MKAGADKLSPAQAAFLAGVAQAGGFAHECRDLAALDAALHQYLSTTLAG